jgi:hypothetical protein
MGETVTLSRLSRNAPNLTLGTGRIEARRPGSTIADVAAGAKINKRGSTSFKPKYSGQFGPNARKERSEGLAGGFPALAGLIPFADSKTAATSLPICSRRPNRSSGIAPRKTAVPAPQLVGDAQEAIPV